MVQWLCLLGVIAVLLVVWRFAARPWLERRAGPVDERVQGNQAASTEARERRARHKDQPEIP